MADIKIRETAPTTGVPVYTRPNQRRCMVRSFAAMADFEVAFSELLPGHVFHLLEEEGEQVRDGDGRKVWFVATSEPYVSPHYEDGRLQVDTEVYQTEKRGDELYEPLPLRAFEGASFNFKLEAEPLPTGSDHDR